MFPWDSPALMEIDQRMATTIGIRRRDWLMACAAAVSGVAQAKTQPRGTLAAAWRVGSREHLGLLSIDQEAVEIGPWLELPTRAHGISVEADGSILACARRPGDWLVRWSPQSGEARWAWMDFDRRFNGHSVALDDRWLLTTETDRQTGAGWLGVRDLKTLAPITAWPTHGLDPHQLLVLPQSVGRWQAGTVLVANGGVVTRAETGRTKSSDRPLDASLVALNPKDGQILGQWKLEDPFLSIRHLAWNASNRCVGIALQAEHVSPKDRTTSPVLAIWDGRSLIPGEASSLLGGYAGDIIALTGESAARFAVSAQRTGRLAFYSTRGTLIGSKALPECCALATFQGTWWSAGKSSLVAGKPVATDGQPAPIQHIPTSDALEIDNHWQPYWHSFERDS